MSDDILTVRERQVLEAVVRNYILTATPTGSRFLAKQSRFGLSPATIRNTMGDLEEKGFIAQPHTSAGRVPTDKGYRCYVDRMMEHRALPEPVQCQIKGFIQGIEPADLHMLMEATSRALGIVTEQLGIILAPRLCSAAFRHVHIFEVDARRYLLHVTVDSGFVRTMTVELESEVSPQRLEEACRILNRRFYGMRLSDVANLEDAVFEGVEPAELGVIRLFVPSIQKMLRDDASETVFTEGETNIVLKPEFSSDKERLGAVVEILAEKRMLMHLFDTDDAEGVVVSIGGENKAGVFESFSVVKSKYRVGSLEGTLGILGPKRMPYPFLVSAVDYTARLLGELRR